MELSKYISDNSERFYYDYSMLCQKLVDFLKENSNLDLEHIAKSTDPVDIYERLKILLLKNNKKGIEQAFLKIGYSFQDFEKSIIMSFLITLYRDEKRAFAIYNVLKSADILDDISFSEEGKCELKTRNFGTIVSYSARDIFASDTEVMAKVSSLKDNLKDACHELAEFLITLYPEFKAITGISEGDLHRKFYHSVVLDEYGFIIDFPNEIVMPKEQYFLLNSFVSMNEVTYSECKEQSIESKKSDESGTLYDLLRNAIYVNLSHKRDD